MDRTTDFTSLEHLPPRHDIESDSEDDAPSRSSRTSPSTSVVISVDGFTGQTDLPLVVVVGKEAKRLADGLEGLGEKDIGRVTEGEKSTIGTFYELGESAHVLYLKETLQLKVPGPLAAKVIELVQPSRVIALDSYLTSSYIPSTSERARKAKSNPDDHPVRYLANTAPNGPPKLSFAILPFSPPNHVRSPSAPFLSLVPISTTTLFPDANVLLLLPAPWPTNTVVEQAVVTLGGLLGGAEGSLVWKDELVSKRRTVVGLGERERREQEEASGGMYM